ncbi:GNAT family N-acetyltransferase [Devosia nitrariae]|uniref:N-acetyltransferase n=1 Tax=Devosia nitrariae TaxID=2071872 RepID=A0ABQ5W332_9HYPH|nr:GNAT family N-acetyltransferase [Devosia nitrariae]GLQ54224.1 N-acetyltransferase [Devosia nitrariae]
MSDPFIEMSEAEPELVDEIERKLLAAIRSSQKQALNSSFTLGMRDESGVLIAGLAASTAYGWLLIKLIWVDEGHRDKGLGRRLMAEAEAEGIRRGCHGAWLDTSMPDSAGFYVRLGYETFGTLENAAGDVVPGHRRWFMRKRLV